MEYFFGGTIALLALTNVGVALWAAVLRGDVGDLKLTNLGLGQRLVDAEAQVAALKKTVTERDAQVAGLTERLFEGLRKQVASASDADLRAMAESIVAGGAAPLPLSRPSDVLLEPDWADPPPA